MNTANHISQDDLLLFALQFLPEEEMAAAHAHLLECDDCRRQVGFVQGDLASYALTAEVQTPPAAAKERLMRAIAREKKVVPIGKSMAVPVAEESTAKTDNVYSFNDAPVVKRRMGFAGWAGWAVAAAAIAAAGLEYQQTQVGQTELAKVQGQLAQYADEAKKTGTMLDTVADPGAKQVALHLPAPGGETTAWPEAHASYVAKKGTVVFVARNLGQLDAGKTYELWLLPTEKGATPVPAGTFKPDRMGRASLVYSALPEGAAAAGFAVTIEPTGGSQTPTMPIVLMGE